MQFSFLWQATVKTGGLNSTENGTTPFSQIIFPDWAVRDPAFFDQEPIQAASICGWRRLRLESPTLSVWSNH
jgi:hypothetical protein